MLNKESACTKVQLLKYLGTTYKDIFPDYNGNKLSK